MKLNFTLPPAFASVKLPSPPACQGASLLMPKSKQFLQLTTISLAKKKTKQKILTHSLARVVKNFDLVTVLRY